MTPDPRANFSNIASRETGRSVLRRRIEQLQREAKQLEMLDKALPLELSPGADEALWELFMRL